MAEQAVGTVPRMAASRTFAHLAMLRKNTATDHSSLPSVFESSDFVSWTETPLEPGSCQWNFRSS